MSDIDQVLARIETDFDFYLAVVGDARRALAAFELSSEELEAFVHPGQPLWGLVLTHTARGPAETPDGGLPPPPPPFVVHHSTPTDFEPWRGDREAELTVLRADPAVQTAVRTVHRARTLPARIAAVAQLVERIG
jgi:hypothetical protein